MNERKWGGGSRNPQEEASWRCISRPRADESRARAERVWWKVQGVARGRRRRQARRPMSQKLAVEVPALAPCHGPTLLKATNKEVAGRWWPVCDRAVCGNYCLHSVTRSTPHQIRLVVFPNWTATLSRRLLALLGLERDLMLST